MYLIQNHVQKFMWNYLFQDEFYTFSLSLFWDVALLFLNFLENFRLVLLIRFPFKKRVNSNFNADQHIVKCVQIRSFFWSVFSCIRNEYGEILRNSPYSFQMWEITDQKKLRFWTLFMQYKELFLQIKPCDLLLVYMCKIVLFKIIDARKSYRVIYFWKETEQDVSFLAAERCKCYPIKYSYWFMSSLTKIKGLSETNLER